MSLIVQKFGGSSLADCDKLLHISHIVKTAYEKGNDVLVVVSAQGDLTDRLIRRAREVSPRPPLRELDALLAVGEQASAALTAMALREQGVPAVSLTAHQLPIRTDGVDGDAAITGVGRARLEREFSLRHVPVVTGFQGIDKENDLTTLGRGGSDYSAVALSAELGAARCLIYTDVDGVYTADPRICPTAKRLARVSYDDMYALSRAGAQVLHDKCVALAQERGVEPEVCSAASGAAGTRICADGEGRDVAGVTCRPGAEDGTAEVTLVGRALPSLALQKRAVLALADAGIAVRGVSAGKHVLMLTVARGASEAAVRAVHDAVIA